MAPQIEKSVSVNENNPLTNKDNPQVFLSFSADNETLGRVVIELFADTVPETAENFRALCTGERGLGKAGKPLCLKGSPLHRVVPGFMCQGGDILRANGTGGESIYGEFFSDENYKVPFTGSGVVAMVPWGKHRNHSQFLVTMATTDWLQQQCVAFGHVIEGMNVIRQIELLGDKFGRTEKRIVIEDSGELTVSSAA